MSEQRIAFLLEWGLRLVVVALLALWVITPPQANIRKAGSTETLLKAGE